MLDFTDVHCCDGGFSIKVPAVLFAKTFDVKYTNGASCAIHTDKGDIPKKRPVFRESSVILF